MKVSEAKKLIGKKIEWVEHYDRHRGCGLPRTAILVEVMGRNMLVDYGGYNDWLWLPNMMFLKEIEK